MLEGKGSLVIFWYQRGSPEDTVHNSLGNVAAKKEVQGGTVTHTRHHAGYFGEAGGDTELCHGQIQSQSKVHARLETGCSYLTHTAKEKA